MKLKLKKKEIKSIIKVLNEAAWKHAFINCDMLRLVDKLNKRLDKSNRV